MNISEVNIEKTHLLDIVIFPHKVVRAWVRNVFMIGCVGGWEVRIKLRDLPVHNNN